MILAAWRARPGWELAGEMELFVLHYPPGKKCNRCCSSLSGDLPKSSEKQGQGSTLGAEPAE